MQSAKIAFIGAGNIASSLIGGLIKSGYDNDNIFVSDLNSDKLISLKTKFGIQIAANNIEAVQSADVIVFSVKPNGIAAICRELADFISEKQLILSVAAGISSQQIQQWLHKKSPVIRCMPNTPALIGVGASGLFANEYVDEQQKQYAESLMRSVGIVVWVSAETEIDAITALSGSGPAYFLYIFETLVKAAKSLGLSNAKQIKLLTLQTALGAACMAMESEDSLEDLRDKVTSPGGTTEAALNILKQKNLDAIFTDTLQAAKQRAQELSDRLSAGTNKALEEKPSGE